MPYSKATGWADGDSDDVVLFFSCGGGDEQHEIKHFIVFELCGIMIRQRRRRRRRGRSSISPKSESTEISRCVEEAWGWIREFAISRSGRGFHKALKQTQVDQCHELRNKLFFCFKTGNPEQLDPFLWYMVGQRQLINCLALMASRG